MSEGLLIAIGTAVLILMAVFIIIFVAFLPAKAGEAATGF